MRDNRTLTILRTVKAHLFVGNLEFAGQVLQAEVVAIELRQKQEGIRDREQHGDVRIGHPHQHVDVSQAHCHRAGQTETRMLPMVVPGDVYAIQDLLEGRLG